MAPMRVGLVAVLLLMGFAVSPVQAILVGEVQDRGANYTLKIDGSGSSYHAVLTIDTSGFTGPSEFGYISAVNFKVASDIDDNSIVLTKMPTGWTGTGGFESNLSNSDVCGNGENGGKGFVCSQAVNPLPVLPGGEYTWEWDFTLGAKSQIFPDLIGTHIGAKYNNADGTLNGWITSKEVAAPVPEPSTLLLLGSGLLGLGGLAWRRNRKS